MEISAHTLVLCPFPFGYLQANLVETSVSLGILKYSQWYMTQQCKRVKVCAMNHVKENWYWKKMHYFQALSFTHFPMYRPRFYIVVNSTFFMEWNFLNIFGVAKISCYITKHIRYTWPNAIRTTPSTLPASISFIIYSFILK